MSHTQLDVLGAVLVGALAAGNATLYGSLGGIGTTNLLLLDLVALIAVAALATQAREGSDWARPHFADRQPEN